VKPAKEKFNIISLGCARNLVDSEVMAGLLHHDGYDMVPGPEEADVVLVNTCGFVDAAKSESIDTILEVARLKHTGRLRKLVVAGCLSQRYPAELAKDLPEVDLFIGTGEVARISEILRNHGGHPERRQYIGVPQYLYDHKTPRLRSTASHSAFLKISEGCDHKCAFCIIPQLRGPHRSRAIQSVVQEASLLAQGGVKEINLIAQDLTAYGRDRHDGTTLYGLLSKLVRIPEIFWIRLLYAYPNYLDAPLLQLIRTSNKICKYVDIPFQHINGKILRAMRRGKGGSAVRETVQTLREAIPDLTLRTSLIVGFPGETDDDFRELLDFVEETKFERLGVFKYSEEEGTAAAGMVNSVSEDEKERRWQEIMDVQVTISRKKNEALIGTTQQVIIDGIESETGGTFGRTQAHAPDVDGGVFLDTPVTATSDPTLPPGAVVRVKITGALDYDLMGETIDG